MIGVSVARGQQSKTVEQTLHHAFLKLNGSTPQDCPSIAVGICHRLVSLLDSNPEDLSAHLSQSPLLPLLQETLETYQPQQLSESVNDFATALFRAALSGKRIAWISDVTDALATISATENRPFEAAPNGIRKLMLSGVPCALISGDSLQNVATKFLVPAGIVRVEENHISPLFHNGTLVLAGDSGSSAMLFRAEGPHEFTLIPGIPSAYMQPIIDYLVELTREYSLIETYYSKYRAESPPGTYEVVGLRDSDNLAIKFYPFGDGISSNLRDVLALDCRDQNLRELLASKIRSFISDNGYQNVHAEPAGKSTIDIGVATKGDALRILLEQKIIDADFIVYFGDSISNAGNDLPAAKIADLALQIGHPPKEAPKVVAEIDTTVLRAGGDPIRGSLSAYFSIICSAVKLSNFFAEQSLFKPLETKMLE